MQSSSRLLARLNARLPLLALALAAGCGVTTTGNSTTTTGGTAGTTTGSTTGGTTAGTTGGTTSGTTGGGTTGPQTLISYTDPVNDANNVAINSNVTVSFVKAMNASTLNATSFSLSPNTVGASNIAGTVTYDATRGVASFNPNTNLAASTQFRARLTTAVTDDENRAVPLTEWTFTTGTAAAMGPPRVLLGASGNYVILAKSAISNVTGSAVTGDMGLSPAAASYITGFSLIADSTNTFSTSSSVVGKVYAADYPPPTQNNLTVAIGAMQAAYTDAAGRVTPDFTNLHTGDLGGQTLTPGLYKWTTNVTIPLDVTISGGENDVWIFQISGDLTMSAAKNVILSGARAKNIFWQVAGSVTVGTNSHLEGIVLCQTAITLQTGASINGRLLAQTAVALDNCTVTRR